MSDGSWSEEREGLFGKYTVYFDSNGQETGWSEEKTGLLGGKYTQNYDTHNSETGWSEEKTGLLGDKYTQNYDTHNSETGWSEEKTGLLGDKYTQNYDTHNSETGWSEEKTGLLGGKYTQLQKSPGADSNYRRSDFSPHRSSFESTSNREDVSPSGSDNSGSYDVLARPFGSIKSSPQRILVIVARFVVAVIAAAITGVITFFLSMIVVGLFFNIVMSRDNLTGWSFLIFVLAWWLPPLLVFILVSGMGKWIAERRPL